jgi:protein involved in polysaccharide export with SLBB domain
MEFELIRRATHLLEPALWATLLVLVSVTAFAQSVQLTPEQQMMLDQLPPAQREQALQVLRQQSAGVQSFGEAVRETPSQAVSPAVVPAPEVESQRASANSRLVINFRPKESLTARELEGLGRDPMLGRIQGSRTFVLDDNGVLSLLGFESIPLLGLSESDIEYRLGAEPLLAQFDVDARILATQPTGAEALKPFGYDIFEPRESGFDPPMTGPVPPDYVLGPEDTVRVQLFGNLNGIYELDVTRDGALNLPEIGPVTVAGLPFSEFRADVNRRVKKMLIGTQASVTMGQLRTIRVFVLGDAKCPGSYVVDSLATISSALYQSGGISRVGSLREIQLKRDGKTTSLKDGDLLLILRVLPDFEGVVTLTGHVHRPGPYQWRAGMRLTDLIGSALELKPGADTGYVMVRREDPEDRAISVVSASLAEALADPASKSNFRLQPRDTVNVFSVAFGRQRVIQPILEELQLQSNVGEPFPEVSISGYVKAPGTYPLEAGKTINGLIRAGGGLAEQAYTLHAEIARYAIVSGETRNTQVIDIDLDALLRGDTTADLMLEEHDNLRISRVPDWDALATVRLEGKVTFPGEYRIRPGETLRQILERADGLTDEAFPDGAVFLRESLKEQEREQIKMLTRRLEADLASLAMQSASSGGSQTLEQGRVLLDQLPNTEAVGRLVIDLDTEADRTSAASIEMRDGDRLLVPTRTQVVSVLGETQQNTSHLYKESLSRDDYINLSGGLTRRADKRRIYIVRANGAVVAGNQSKWLGRGGRFDIRPGDTIVVPLNADKMRPMTFWTNVTQILYQDAIAVVAIKTFNS